MRRVWRIVRMDMKRSEGGAPFTPFLLAWGRSVRGLLKIFRTHPNLCGFLCNLLRLSALLYFLK
jgi:hypothetical protein